MDFLAWSQKDVPRVCDIHPIQWVSLLLLRNIEKSILQEKNKLLLSVVSNQSCSSFFCEYSLSYKNLDKFNSLELLYVFFFCLQYDTNTIHN